MVFNKKTGSVLPVLKGSMDLFRYMKMVLRLQFVTLFFFILVAIWFDPTSAQQPTCSKKTFSFTVAFAPPPPMGSPPDLNHSLLFVFYDDDDSPDQIVTAICGNHESCALAARRELQMGGREDSKRLVDAFGGGVEKTKALAIPAADYYSEEIQFTTLDTPNPGTFLFVHYAGTSLEPSAFFFCQWHFVTYLKSAYTHEDVFACRDVVVTNARRGADGGDVGEVDRHSGLRMEWYNRIGVQGNKGPTPANPQCFEGIVSLGCLFLLHNTDKGWHHGYQRTYATVLSEYRDKKDLKLLEIGVFQGGSTRVWESYFQGEESHFYGLGYGEDYFQGGSRMKYGDRTDLFYGDQGDVVVLNGLMDDIGGEDVLDIIIDDGSHDPAHQMISFEHLFPFLKEGGLYVFEDIETSYWNGEGAGLYGRVFGEGLGVGGGRNVVEKFLRAVDYGLVMNGLFVGRAWEGGEGWGRNVPPHSDLISSVYFSQNMIVVRKKDDGDDWVRAKNDPYMHRGMTKSGGS